MELKKVLFADIRKEELCRVLPLTLAYGIVMASIYVLKPARNALFLNSIGIHQLPYVLILVALVGGVVASFYGRLSRCVRIFRLIQGTFFILISNLLAFRLILPYGWAWSFYAFYVWVNIYSLMAVSLLWLLANATFNPREAKRLFGLIGTGGILGAILGGLFTGLAVGAIGTENLLLVCVGLLGICLFLIWTLSLEEQPSDQEEKTPEGVLEAIVRHDLLRLLGTMAALVAVVAAVVEVQFNDIVDKAFATKDAKTAFFGEFFAYLSAFAFLFQFLVTPRILRFFGVGVALVFLPMGLAFGSLAVMISPGLWAGAAVKISDGGFRHSIHKSAVEILFLPVPSSVKQQTKVFLDVTVDNLATGLGAVLILLLTGPFGVAYQHLSLMSLGLIAVWVGLTFRLRKAYVDAFRTALSRRSLDIHRERAWVSDAGAVRLLIRALESRDEREVQYALDLLETVRNMPLTPHLVRLLRHPLKSIRKRAISVLLSSKDKKALPEVKYLLNDASIEVQTEAVHYICQCDELPPMEQIRCFLNDTKHSIRAAAAACLILNHSQEDGQVLPLARQTLATMLDGGQGVQGKLEAARALEMTRDRALLDRLYFLLHDESPAVVIQAIQSAGILADPEFIPELIQKLEDRRFRRKAIQALAQYGAGVLDNLEAFLENQDTSTEIRKHILRVLGHIQDPRAADLLLKHLKDRDASMRYEVLRVLNRLREKDEILNFGGVPGEVLDREVRDYYEMLHLRRLCFPGDAEKDLLNQVLEERLKQALERIFLLLALIYPRRDIQRAYSALTGTRKTLRPGAVEFLDNLLNLDDRRKVLPLVEDLSSEERLNRGSQLFEKRDCKQEDVLLDFMQDGDAWLRACAVYTAGLRGIEALRGRVEAAHTDEDPLVREAAALAIRQVRGKGQMRPRLEKAIFLRHAEIFSNTTIQELTRIAGIAQQVHFTERTTVWEKETPGDALYLLVSGQICLHRADRNLEVIGPGESVGIWELFDGRPRGTMATALEDAAILRIDRKDLFALMDVHPEISRGILKSMVHHLRRLADGGHPEETRREKEK